MSKLVTVPGVEAFCTGVHRKNPYVKADLDQMARNFSQLRGTLDPPLVIGHEEAGTWLKDTGYPSAGRVANVRNNYTDDPCLQCGGTGRRGTSPCPFCAGRGLAYVQFVDFVDVPKTFANLIKGRAYSKVSSEVYDDFEHGGRHYGKALRRVAMLGGELPQIKTLADLPTQDYSERAPRTARIRPGMGTPRDGVGYFVAFSEVIPMAVKARTKKGPVSAKAKATWKKFADEVTPEAAAAPPPDTAPEDVKGMLVEMGFDAAALEGASDVLLAEIVRVFKTMESTAAMSDVPAPPPVAGATQAAGAVTGGGQSPSQVIVKYNEKGEIDIAKLISDMQAEVTAGVRKTIDGTTSDLRKASIQAFCESMVQAGKMLPAELEKTDKRPGAVEFAHSLDNVKKFGENGPTQLDQWMEGIRSRPQLVKFSETVKGGGTGGKSSASDDVKVVEAHYESFSETFAKHGVTKESLVKGYENSKKHDPDLTPEKFLNAR